MPEEKAGSIRLHYERRGSGPALVLVMGFGGSGAMWDDAFVDRLATQFDVIVPDNRGTGQSEKIDEEIEIATFADDIANLLDALSLPSAHLFGVSMGGMIAQEFALRHPERLRGLVLGCTHPGGVGAVPAQAEVVRLLLPQKGLTPREAISSTYAAMCTPETIAERVRFLDTMAGRMLAHRTPLFVFGRQMAAIGRFDVYDRIASITAPTLVITGDRDRLVPPENSSRIAARIPGARLVTIPGAAHNFFWEAPEATASAVTDFLIQMGD